MGNPLLKGLATMRCCTVFTSVLFVSAFSPDTYSQAPRDTKPSIADIIERTIEEKGVEAGIARYKELKKQSPTEYDLGADQLRVLAEKLFRRGKQREALQFGEALIGLFPDNADVYFDLARGYFHAGDRKKSRRNVRKSLELDPKNLSAVRLRKDLTFVSDTFVAPMLLETDAFRLRPLRAADVDLDYKAVMSSLDHLQGVFGPRSGWPGRNLTRGENLRSLQGHEMHFRQRVGFTYTVVNLQETECLGCVYIYPSKLDKYDAEVVMWVTADASQKGLDGVLYDTTRKWLDNKWPFKKVVYPGRQIDWAKFYKLLSEQDKKYD